MPVAAGLIFAFALWFGLFLLARDARDGRLRLAGGGLVAVAISAGAAAAIGTGGSTYPQLLRAIRDLSVTTAAYLFLGAIIEAQRSLGGSGNFPARAWTLAAVPLLALCTLAALFANSSIESGASATTELWPAILLIVAGAATVAGIGILFRLFREIRPRPASPTLVAAAVVIAGGIAAFYLRSDDALRLSALAAIAVGMTAMGVAHAAAHARDEGHALLPDLLRSFDFAMFTAAVFGGQVLLVMVFATGPTQGMTLLLLGVVAASISGHTFWSPMQAAVERLAYARYPRVRVLSADIRATSAATRRGVDSVDLAAMDDDEFVRITRRTLTHLGDLPRLAASPLSRLPAIEVRIVERGAIPATLERAAELRSILTDTIDKLKPRATDEFEGGPEWRHFNSLYYPYVVGIKPYSVRSSSAGLDVASRAAFDWFRSQVPERTLHNWQNEAAELVANHLRETAISTS